MIGRREAYVIRRLLIGEALNGEADALSSSLRRLAEHLDVQPVEDRLKAWEGFRCGLSDPEGAVAALAAVNPTGPMPEPDARRFATVADVRRLLSGTRWTWDRWIPSARIVGIGAFEGTGKTRLALDLCRRAYLGLEWPDLQPPTLPPGTRSVWMCSDAHQDELADMLPAFGLPDDAVVFPTAPEEPYGGTDLDDPETLETLEAAIAEVRPAFVFIDTLTSATERDLCDQRSMKPLKAPLAHLAQTYQVNVMLQLHLSREGQALGRRIKGITRTLIHLECPDPEVPARLRLWVEKTYAKRPPALGVTMGDGGNEYDFEPPTAKAPERGSGGRPPEKLDKAIGFLVEKLSAGDRKGCELIDEWLALREAKGTIFNAKKMMEQEGRLTVDDSKRPYIWHLNLAEPGEVNNPVSDPF